MHLKACAKHLGVLLLSVGLIVHLTASIIIRDGSRYTTLLNLLLFLPALLLTVSVSIHRRALLAKGMLFPVCYLAFVVVIAAFHPASEGAALQHLKTMLYILIYLSAINIAVREGKLLALLTLSYGIATLAAAASLLYQGVILKQDLFSGINRISSLGYGGYADFRNPIISALYFGVFALFGFHQMVRSRGSLALNASWGASVAILCLYIFCTDSRGVWLGLTAAALTVLVLQVDQKKAALVAAAAVPGLFAAAYILTAKGRGLSLRDQIWAGVYNRLGEFWLFGAGAGHPLEICVDTGPCFNQAHNLFLQTFYEFGLLGLLLLIGLVAAMAYKAMFSGARQHPLGLLGLPWLTYAVATALVDYHTVLNRPGVYWLVFWLPIGLILAIHANRNPERVRLNAL